MQAAGHIKACNNVAFHWWTWHVAQHAQCCMGLCGCVCMGMLTLAAVKTDSVPASMHLEHNK